MRIKLILLILSSLTYLSQSFGKKFITPDEILKKTDEVRNPSDFFQMKVELKTEDSSSLFEVFIGGKERTLIKTLEPVHDRGRNFLMINEDMWAYIPSLGRPLKVTLSQKLIGQAANGDLARFRYYPDYTPIIEKEESNRWILQLTANKKDLTYDKIRLTVEKKTFHPLFAEYLTMNNLTLKESFFSGYKIISHKLRPTILTIFDTANPKNKSVITILKTKVTRLPQSIYNQNSLKD